jgi:hypothetical protein
MVQFKKPNIYADIYAQGEGTLVPLPFRHLLDKILLLLLLLLLFHFFTLAVEIKFSYKIEIELRWENNYK